MEVMQSKKWNQASKIQYLLEKLKHKKLIIFDRDNTLIWHSEKMHSVFPNEKWKYADNVVETISLICQLFPHIHICMLTNQTRCKYNMFEKILQERISSEVFEKLPSLNSINNTIRKGIVVLIDKDTAKPNPECLTLVSKAMGYSDFHIYSDETLVVGDAVTDMGLAYQAGLDFEWSEKFFSWDPKLVIACGVIGSGKTYGMRSYYPDCVPMHVDIDLSVCNPTLTQNMRNIHSKVYFDQLKDLLVSGKSIYLDNNNLKITDRQRWIEFSNKLNNLGISNRIICQLYDLPKNEDNGIVVDKICDRLSLRSQITIKLRDRILEEVAAFERPTIDEKFDEIIVTPWMELKNRDL